MTGPSGQGKTRLALKAARDAKERGWQVLTARHLPNGEPVGPPAEVRPAGKYAGGLSVEHDVIPPTRNLAEAGADPGLGLDIVTSPRQAAQRAAISNSFGFGGQNVSLLFSKPAR